MNAENKQNQTLAYYLRIGCSLLVICAIMALLLAVVNGFTAERIAENARLETEKTISEIFGEGISTQELEYTGDDSVDSVFEVSYDGAFVGYAVLCSPSGFKGEIDLAVGVNPDGSCRSVRVISQSETPGLGAKITDAAFTDHFAGRTGALAVTKDGGDIDAIAGATISSRAVTDGVNDALAAVELLNGGGAQ